MASDSSSRAFKHARQNAIHALGILGIASAHKHMKTPALLAAIELLGFARGGNEQTIDYLNRFSVMVRHRHEPATTRYTRPFKEMKPENVKPHLRQAEIDAQPHQISMGGIGIGEGVMGQNIQRGRSWR